MQAPAYPEDFCLYDTTLRDGAQQEGMQLSVADKLKIATILDDLGVQMIEGGWPGANPNDTAFFAEAAKSLKLHNAQLVAFGATRKANTPVEDDPLIQALLDAQTEWICLVAKSYSLHVTQALHTTLEENLAMVTDTVSYLRAAGRKVIVDCEHFFDGFAADPGYAIDVIKAAAEAGAEYAVLCDTNGGMLPSQIGDVVSRAIATGVKLGIHCHNDTGCAVANSIAAIDAGVLMVQGTINGYGERTGNMDLTTLIADVQLKYEWPLLTAEQLATLTHVSNRIADIANQPRQPRQPYVGASSFAHKAGLHASAIKVNHDLYQHIRPELVGNDMRMLISDMSGRASVQIKAEQLGLDLSDPTLAAEIAALVKDREAAGYSYEAADASFELLVLDQQNQLPKPFEVLSWRVFTAEAPGAQEVNELNSEATVKLLAGGARHTYLGEGNGPVNALGEALTRALEPSFPAVAAYELTDYRVRILDAGRGTDATVRVLIDTRDQADHAWTTVGVGTNVIEASWEALADSFLYGLLKGY
jgi:2-isopropylmalate synthase